MHPVNPIPRHAGILAGLIADVGAGANLVNDVHLEALAIEHPASLVSYDTDFGRSAGVRWHSPTHWCKPFTL